MAQTNAERQARHREIARLKVDFFSNVENRLEGARNAGVVMLQSVREEIVLAEYRDTQERIFQLKRENERGNRW